MSMKDMKYSLAICELNLHQSTWLCSLLHVSRSVLSRDLQQMTSSYNLLSSGNTQMFDYVVVKECACQVCINPPCILNKASTLSEC